MRQSAYIALATLGSALLLASAFGFQYIGGMPPCELCLWQRWPHGAAILIGLCALAPWHWSRGRILPCLGGLAALSTATIAAYHTGVERGWLQGPAACTGLGSSDVDLLSLDGPLGVVMCDQVAWQFAGLSMASWNMLASLALAILWARAARG